LGPDACRRSWSSRRLRGRTARPALSSASTRRGHIVPDELEWASNAPSTSELECPILLGSDHESWPTGRHTGLHRPREALRLVMDRRIAMRVCIVELAAPRRISLCLPFRALSREILPTFQREILSKRTVSSNISWSATHKELSNDNFLTSQEKRQTSRNV
jgi:hypothetical protein